MKTHHIGIMQGRLTPPRGRGIQFFPWDNWQNEFSAGQKLALSEIEWIFDLDEYEKNPLWTNNAHKELESAIERTGVRIRFICADIFMKRPFIRTADNVRHDNIRVLKTLIGSAKKIGAVGIEIPCVDNASVKTPEEEQILINSLTECLPDAVENNITINLEMDYPPKEFLRLLKRFNHTHIKANYDSGNSSGLGYHCAEEIATYGSFIANVHIKDRVYKDGTVALGTGSANFDELFSGLQAAHYAGSFILQAARGPEGQEEEAIQNQISFVKKYLRKYHFL